MFGFKRNSNAVSLADIVDQVARDEITLIDVRDHSEVSMSGKAEGALHIPLMRLSMVADPRHPDFDKSLCMTKPIALYCASGARSGMAANILKSIGYENVHNIGGFSNWRAAGGRCTK